MFPLVFPNGKRLYEYAGFQKYVVGDIRQREFGIEKLATLSAQQHGHIGVAIRPVVPARAATKENCAQVVVLTRHLGEEGAYCVCGFGVDIRDFSHGLSSKIRFV